MRKSKALSKTETNATCYNRIRKYVLENSGRIDCSHCPYHRYDNYTNKDSRNWKRYRKTQYKNHGN